MMVKTRTMAETMRLITLMIVVGVCFVENSPRFFCLEFITSAIIAKVMPTGKSPNSEVTRATIASTNGVPDT